jgi:hypothetical protein
MQCWRRGEAVTVLRIRGSLLGKLLQLLHPLTSYQSMVTLMQLQVSIGQLSFRTYSDRHPQGNSQCAHVGRTCRSPFLGSCKQTGRNTSLSSCHPRHCMVTVAAVSVSCSRPRHTGFRFIFECNEHVRCKEPRSASSNI